MAPLQRETILTEIRELKARMDVLERSITPTIGLPVLSVVPAAPPAGILLYVQGGQLKAKGPTTTTNLAPQ